MKVISLFQPWAQLVIIGAKQIETRSWDTRHRGDLLIHASQKQPSKSDRSFFETHQHFAAHIKSMADLQYGAIIGKVTLVKTERSEVIKANWIHELKSEWNTQPEYAFGDYADKRFGWHLKDSEAFDQPIVRKGALQLWDFAMCRQCGCWEGDACYHRVRGNCHWAGVDLCSHCAISPGEAIRHSKLKKPAK